MPPPEDDEDDDDDDEEEEEDDPPNRGTGNALLIAAGATGALGIIFNALRVYTVTGPCQTTTQDNCSAAWTTTGTPFRWSTRAPRCPSG